MAERNRLKGVDVRQVVEVANSGGQKAAANKFGVSQAAISNLLRNNGYIPKITYVHAGKNKQPSTQQPSVERANDSICPVPKPEA
jgi:hypothetical protein